MKEYHMKIDRRQFIERVFGTVTAVGTVHHYMS